MAKKMKEVTNDAETLEKLGITNPEIPGGETVVETTGLPNEQEPTQKVQAEPDTSGEQKTLDLEGEKEVSSTQDAEGNLTEEEKQRRTWQAEADTAKAEKDKLQSDLRLAQEQNRNLLNVVTPFMNKYQQEPQTKVEQPDSEPVADFVDDEGFDPKKFADYQRKHDKWLMQNAKSDMKSEWQKERNGEDAQRQIAEVIKEYPEYVNPLTGEPDINRLQRDLQGLTQGKTMLDLVNELKGTKGEKSQSPLGSDASIDAIEKNANRPQSVVDSLETESEKKKVPENLQKAVKMGLVDINNLPADFDGLE